MKLFKMSGTDRKLQCPKCNNVCSSFSDLCNHVEEIHEMWYLNKRYHHAACSVPPSPPNSQKSLTYCLPVRSLHTTYSKIPDAANDKKEEPSKRGIQTVLQKLSDDYAKLEDGVQRIYDELKVKNNCPQEKKILPNWNNLCMTSQCSHNIQENTSLASLHLQNFHAGQDKIFSPNVSSISVKDSNEHYAPCVISNTFHEDSNQFQMLTIPEQLYSQCLTCPLCAKDDSNLSGHNLLMSNMFSKGKPIRRSTPRNSHVFPSSDIPKFHGNCQSEESTICKHISSSQTSQTDSGKGESICSKSVSYIKGAESTRMKRPSISPRRTSSRPSSNHDRNNSSNIKSDTSVSECKSRFYDDFQNFDTVLLQVFHYLSTNDLLNCRLVCKKWRRISQQPSYYINVVITDRIVSSNMLISIAESCCNMQSLTLQDLRGREKRDAECDEEYRKKMRGCLELGFEALLKAAQHTLTILSIVSCGNILTERSLWLASCYCRELSQVAYFSQLYPATPESLWSLGSGCRKIQTLIVPPLYPSCNAKKFSTRCLHMIAKCWPNLRTLCIGGTEVGTDGLITIALNCHRLKILELDHMGEVQEAAIISICKNGLRALHKMYFTHTPVTADALLHLYSACPHLTVIGIILRPSDYFTHPEYPPNIEEFKMKILKLKKLQELPGLSSVLKISIQ